MRWQKFAVGCVLFLAMAPYGAAELPVVEAFSINGDAARTEDRNVTLNSTCSGNPTHYMADNSSSFPSGQWKPYATAVSFELSIGSPRTVHFKVKNDEGQSPRVFDHIYVGEDPPVMFVERAVTGLDPNGWFIPGTTSLDITVTADAGWNTNETMLTAFAMEEDMPAGWTFESIVSTNMSDPNIAPSQGEGDGSALQFVWFDPMPTFRLPDGTPQTNSLTYRVNVPSGSGPWDLVGRTLYRTDGEEETSGDITTTIEVEPTTVKVSRTVSNVPPGGFYVAGRQMDVELAFTRTGHDALTAFSVGDTVPDGWLVVADSIVANPMPNLAPGAGDSGLLQFLWYAPLPELPFTLSYSLALPEEITGEFCLDGIVNFQAGGPELNSNQVLTCLEESPCLVLSRDVIDPPHDAEFAPLYLPGRNLTFEVTLDSYCAEGLTALAVEESLPGGWALVSVDGDPAPNNAPQAGETADVEPFEFAWSSPMPTVFPYSFRYTVSVPAEQTGAVAVTGGARYQLSASELQTNGVETEIHIGNQVPPVITLNGENPVTVPCGVAYTDAGATADDDINGDVTEDIVTTGSVNTGLPGQYTIAYDVSDALGNAAETVTRTVNVADETAPEIQLSGAAAVTVPCGNSYADAGAIGTDACDGSLGALAGSGNVDTDTPGEYSITFNATDSSGNAAVPITRTVTVVDDAGPVITLNGSATVSVECRESYTDADAAAADACEGDLGAVAGVGAVNTDVPGTYMISYDARDSVGNNAATVTRTVEVVDTAGPMITLNGDPAVTVTRGDTYSDAGATAADVCEGDLGSVTGTGNVDTSTPGSYTLRYNASDSSGNAAAEVTRSVEVEGSVLATPTGLQATLGVHSDKVVVTWDAVPEAAEYQVYRDLTPITGWITDTVYEDKTAFVSCPDSHGYRVVARDEWGESAISQHARGCIRCPKPDAPTGLSATQEEFPNKVVVSWNTTAEATEYQVYRDAVPLSGWLADTTYADTTAFLTCPSTHWYWVVARNECGEGTPSGYAGGCVDCPRPDVPADVEATDEAYLDRVCVTWTAANLAKAYRVYRDLEPISEWLSFDKTEELAFCDEAASALCPDLHLYRVAAMNDCGASELSDPDTGCLDFCHLPGAPADVSATDGEYLDKVCVTWSASALATAYKVYRNMEPISDWIAVGKPSSPQFCDASVSSVCPSNAWYRVAAKNICGASEVSEADGGCVAACPVPGPPDGVSAAQGAEEDFVRVTWQGVQKEGVTYRVYRDGAPIGTWQETLTYDDASATRRCPNTHVYQVSARNGCGEGPLSAEAEGCLLETCPPPAAPGELSASQGAHGNKIQVQWQPVSGSSMTYRIFRDGVPLGDWGDTVQHSDFGAGRRCPDMHEYRVQARNGCGSESPLSAPFYGCRGQDSHGNSPEEATAVPPDAVGTAQQGSIETAGDTDYFVFEATAGQRYVIKTGDLPGAKLILYAVDGTTVLMEAVGAPGSSASEIEWVCPVSGAYYVSVGETSGATGAYQLLIDEAKEVPEVVPACGCQSVEDVLEIFRNPAQFFGDLFLFGLAIVVTMAFGRFRSKP